MTIVVSSLYNRLSSGILNCDCSFHVNDHSAALRIWQPALLTPVCSPVPSESIGRHRLLGHRDNESRDSMFNAHREDVLHNGEAMHANTEEKFGLANFICNLDRYSRPTVFYTVLFAPTAL